MGLKIRLINEAKDGEIASGFIDGVDTPPDDMPADDAPFWAITSATDVDTAVRDITAQAESWRVIEANASAQRQHHESRLARLLDKYGHLIAAEVPVEVGKTRRYFTGPVTGGKYCHQPDRLPKIKLSDPDAALKAGYAQQVPVIKPLTDAIRAAGVLPPDCGVTLIPQATVSYSAPKGA